MAAISTSGIRFHAWYWKREKYPAPIATPIVGLNVRQAEVEALAAGVPVVQPNHGAFPELLAATGGGRLVPSGDPRALAEYERCFADPATIHATCEDYRAAATIDLLDRIKGAIEESSNKIPKAAVQLSTVTQATEMATVEILNVLDTMSHKIKGFIEKAGRADKADFIAAFTGSHRFVLDYLVEEILKRQPEHIRSFLLQTAILDRLSGSLCDAVTGREDGKETLDFLERSNLFVIAGGQLITRIKTEAAAGKLSADVIDAQGRTKTVRQPYVDPKRCTGCGACEFACPVKGSPAIYVTAAGERPRLEAMSATSGTSPTSGTDGNSTPPMVSLGV